MYFRAIRATYQILGPDFKYGRSSLLCIKPGLLSLVCNKSGGHKIKYTPYSRPCAEDHDHKNMRLKRPMSPHLAIYAPTLPSMTSIAQRATGVILAFYAFMLASGTLFLSNGVETYVSIIQSLHLGRMSVFLLKIILGAPFFFHYFNAMRYVVWNATAKYLKMKDVYDTAKKAILGAVIFTLLFAFI